MAMNSYLENRIADDGWIIEVMVGDEPRLHLPAAAGDCGDGDIDAVGTGAAHRADNQSLAHGKNCSDRHLHCQKWLEHCSEWTL